MQTIANLLRRLWPLKILHTYILRQIFGRLVVASALLTAIMLLLNIGRMSRIAAKMGFSLLSVVESTFYVIPSILSATLPIALLIAVVSTFGYLVDTNEYTAVRAAGVSPYWMILPALGVGVLLTLATLGVSDGLVEWGQVRLRENILRSVRDSLADSARPGRSLALSLGGGRTFMMDFLVARDGRRPVSISIYGGSELQECIFAAHHEITFGGEEEDVTRVTLTLFDGEQFRDPLRVLKFDKEIVSYSIPSDLTQRLTIGTGATSLSIRSNLIRQKEAAAEIDRLRPALLESTADLLARGAASGNLGFGEDAAVVRAAMDVTRTSRLLQRAATDRGARAIEIQRKLATAFASLAFVLFGTFIGLRFGQGGMIKCGFLSLAVISAFYLLQIMGRALAEDQGQTGFLWIPTATLGLLGAIALQRHLRTT